MEQPLKILLRHTGSSWVGDVSGLEGCSAEGTTREERLRPGPPPLPTEVPLGGKPARARRR
jgi:hypothetical protein